PAVHRLDARELRLAQLADHGTGLAHCPRHELADRGLRIFLLQCGAAIFDEAILLKHRQPPLCCESVYTAARRRPPLTLFSCASASSRPSRSCLRAASVLPRRSCSRASSRCAVYVGSIAALASR